MKSNEPVAHLPYISPPACKNCLQVDLQVVKILVDLLKASLHVYGKFFKLLLANKFFRRDGPSCGGQ